MALDTQPKNIIGIIPPQNLEAEQAVLGALLIDQNAMIKVADVLAIDDFYAEKHQTVYEAMIVLYNKREPIDLLSLSNTLDAKNALQKIGGRAYLAELTNTVPTASNVEHYAKIVQQKATLRRLMTAGHEIVSIGQDENTNVEQLLDKAEQSIFSVSQKYLKQNFVPIHAILTDAFDRLDEIHRHEGALRGIPTGFADLDNMLGGLQKSDLVILAARPSMGKTGLALDIARHAAVHAKIPTAIVSLEMSKDQLGDRLLCAEASVDLWKMRTGKLQNDEDFANIGRAMGELSEAPLYIDDSASATVMEIRTKARRLQLEHGIGLLVIDYLQLMEGQNRKGDNRVQEIAEISRGLKSIARELNIPVLALSQLSRAVELSSPPIPKLSHLRESGCLTGDTLIFDATNGQRIPIRDIAERELSFNTIALNDQFQLKQKRLKKAWKSGVKPVFKLELRSGRTITASGNHPFRSFWNWKPLQELQVDEAIAIPRILSTQPVQHLEESKIILLAHLIGDGCVVKHQPVHYTNEDSVLIDIVWKAAVSAFPMVTPRIVKQESWYHVYLPGRDPEAKRHNPIMRWLGTYGLAGKRSYEKYIPDEVFSAPLHQQALFLKHLWATDGSITRDNTSGKWRIYYASSSRRLIDDVAHLLLRFGIIGRINSSQKNHYRPTFYIDVSGTAAQKIFLQQIGCVGKKEEKANQALIELLLIKENTNVDVIPKAVWKIIEEARMSGGLTTREFHHDLGWAYSGTQRHNTGISRERLSHVLTAVSNQKLQQLATSDVFWDVVKSITPLGEQAVYDAEVEGDHNFVANDIIVHNSIEQDADVVMFIYREEYYKRDTDRKHIADVFIAKHRNGPTGQLEIYFDIEKATFKNLEKRFGGPPGPPPPEAVF